MPACGDCKKGPTASAGTSHSVGVLSGRMYAAVAVLRARGLITLLGALWVAVNCGKSGPSDDLTIAPSSGSDAATEDPRKRDSGVECIPPAMLCGGRCADIAGDPANCGGCNAACPPGDNCVEGVCAMTGCPADRQDCGGLCVDLSDNPVNCGACNVACPPPEQCVEGSCNCQAPDRPCDGVCTDLAVSSEHCGACGNACGFDEKCSGGTCQPRCAAPLVFCADRCADLATDPSACGSCETACQPNEVCSGGLCECPADGTHALCDGVCADLQSHASHCGGCGNACPAGMHCAGGLCTSCQNDFFFCPSPTGDPLQTCLAQARDAAASDAGSSPETTGAPAPLSPNLECQCTQCLVELQDCVNDPFCITTWQCAMRNACTVPCWDSMGVCGSALRTTVCLKWCAVTGGSTQTAARAEALLRCTKDNGCGI